VIWVRITFSSKTHGNRFAGAGSVSENTLGWTSLFKEITMKRLTLPLLAALLVLLSGCASTVRTNVTVFSDWPAALPDQTYVFERTEVQDKDLEYLNYENLVRNEVRRLGLTEAETGKSPTLKIILSYNVNETTVRSFTAAASTAVDFIRAVTSDLATIRFSADRLSSITKSVFIRSTNANCMS
jgi:hypothetical protein